MTCCSDRQKMEFDLVECIVEHRRSSSSSNNDDSISSSLESDDDAPVIVVSCSRSVSFKI